MVCVRTNRDRMRAATVAAVLWTVALVAFAALVLTFPTFTA